MGEGVGRVGRKGRKGKRGEGEREGGRGNGRVGDDGAEVTIVVELTRKGRSYGG